LGSVRLADLQPITGKPEESAVIAFKMFGNHDDKTKQQMARCMTVGSVAGGVLCADGHLGYAQPVGGVIAYEEHVSVSGVGFDIGCGNMAVSGIESAKSAESLYSTIHGAGRVMSRTEARGKRNRKTGEVLSAGRISYEEMQAWLRDRGVMLQGADLDEAPQSLSAASRSPRLP
jgi:tRNA-splicing ligase RtcB